MSDCPPGCHVNFNTTKEYFETNCKFFSQKRKTNEFVARTIQHSYLLEFTAKKLRRLGLKILKILKTYDFEVKNLQ